MTAELVAAPGLEVSEVEQRSSVRLRVPLDLSGLSAAQSLAMHTFRFGDPEFEFLLTKGERSLMILRDGVVQSVRITPHQGPLRGAEASALAMACALRIGSRWSVASVAASVEDSIRRVEFVRESLAGVWCERDWRVELRIRRPARERDEFAVMVMIY